MTFQYSELPTAQGKSTSGLFAQGTLYEVPGFQRGYSWEEEDVDKLLKDFSASYASRPNEPYLLGQTILCVVDGSNRLSVIDGQQRMTTLFIFMAIAVAELKQREDMTENHKENLVLFQVALRQRLRENEFEPRILVTKSGRDCVDQILSGATPSSPTNPSERNLSIAHETNQEVPER